MPGTLKKVYHASKQQGLKVITPRVSTHGRPWVYATKDPVMAACFLGELGGDFTCAVGRDPETGKPFICERFEGAFELRYGGVRGSIYVLPGDTFLEGQTGWEEEVVSPEPVVPVKEIRVADALAHLLQLAEEDRLIIKRYPEKIADISVDDSDLVERAVQWTRQFGPMVLEEFKKYHPHLVEAVLQRLKEVNEAKERGRP